MKIYSFIIAFSLIYLLLGGLVQAKDVTQSPLSAAVIANTVDDISDVLIKYYVYPDTAAKIQSHINRKKIDGSYASSTDLRHLITQIQTDMIDVSGDGHIGLLLAGDSNDRKSQALKPSEPQKSVYSEIVSIPEVGHTVGYLKIDSFINSSDYRDSLINAMEKVFKTSALIIDLRENRGGDPHLVALLSSYFVDDNILLWSIVNKDGDHVFEAKAPANTKKYAGALCLLTSKKTYSAAEALAYTLKNLQRACIVGEASGGGAHLVTMKRVNDQIDFRIPVARAYSPVTKTNWEGIGVTPTHEVEATDAKANALRVLAEKIYKNSDLNSSL